MTMMLAEAYASTAKAHGVRAKRTIVEVLEKADKDAEGEVAFTSVAFSGEDLDVLAKALRDRDVRKIALQRCALAEELGMTPAARGARASAPDIAPLASLVARAHSLAELNIVDCKLGEDAAMVIVDHLGSAALQILRLSGNRIGPRVAQAGTSTLASGETRLCALTSPTTQSWTRVE